MGQTNKWRGRLQWGENVCLLSCICKDPANLCLDFLNLFPFFVAVFGTLYQPKMFVFDNQLSLWCVYEQLGQNPLKLPLSFIVLELY